MRINADFSRHAVITGGEYDWVASPLPGVDRVMLDRIGGEVARATSIVRYAAGSRFSEHVHGGGEEFLVLDGIFSDAQGDYPPGTYVRNPVGTRHAPWSEAGCTLFVKLCQFQPGDAQETVIDTGKSAWQPGPIDGLSLLPLHEYGSERVRLVRFAAGTRFSQHDHPDGEEILVLEGVLNDEAGASPAGTWRRYPSGSAHTPFSDEGCLLYVKSGHLDPPIGPGV